MLDTRRSQPVARDSYVARGDILNETTYFNPFHGKAQIQRRINFEKL
jgi:hypothetical protein